MQGVTFQPAHTGPATRSSRHASARRAGRWLLVLTVPLVVGAWSQRRLTASTAATSRPTLEHALVEDVLAGSVRRVSRRVTQDPYDPYSHRQLARYQMDLARLDGDEDRLDRAARALARSLFLQPRDNVEAECLAVRLDLARHRFVEAERRAGELWRLRRNPAQLLALWGDALLELGQLDAARSRYSLYALREPGLGADARLARLHHLEGDTDTAVALYTRAASGAGSHETLEAAWAHAMISTIERERGHLDAAEAAARTARALVPDHPLALSALAQVHIRRDDHAGARPVLELGIRRHRDPALLIPLATVLERLGHRAEASRLVTEVRRHYEADLARGRIGHRRALATLLLDQGGDPARALRLAREEGHLRKDAHTAHLLARACRASGFLQEAALHAKRSLRHGIQEAALHREAALIARELGLEEEATRHAERAEELGADLGETERSPS